MLHADGNSLSPHPPTFFIFSNDFEWVRGQSLFSSLPGNVVLVTDEDEVMSFYMMILSRYGIICANSSYCWWAAFLRKNKEAEVIAPKPWFSGMQEPFDLIPANWQRIDAGF